VFGVSDFVAVLNQTLEFTYPSIVIVGELANFRVSKNRWVYFDLKDETASVRFFGTVYNLPGPLEDGMMLQVRGAPRLHPLYNFSVNVQSIQPVGEGSLKRAAALLQAKLEAEGLFDPMRKRTMPYPPGRIGLITSSESAAYADFIKILNERWGGIDIELADVQVQGEAAPMQIVRAIEWFNEQAELPEVLVITRGGGSAEDLAAFSTEQVTRAIAASRIPTLVAIGHEVDLSLAEMAADRQASTPSNAAQFLTPDKREETARVKSAGLQLGQSLSALVADWKAQLKLSVTQLRQAVEQSVHQSKQGLESRQNLLMALSPEAVLQRGYAIVRKNGTAVKSMKQLKTHDQVSIQLSDGTTEAKVVK
jgi:exodeoxyribonuclease VII large subunit